MRKDFWKTVVNLAVATVCFGMIEVYGAELPGQMVPLDVYALRRTSVSHSYKGSADARYTITSLSTKIRVLELRNGWACVEYALANRQMVRGWLDSSNLLYDVNYNGWEGKITKSVSLKRNFQEMTGKVMDTLRANDSVYVVGEANNKYQVVCKNARLNSYELGWVEVNAVQKVGGRGNNIQRGMDFANKSYRNENSRKLTSEKGSMPFAGPERRNNKVNHKNNNVRKNSNSVGTGINVPNSRSYDGMHSSREQNLVGNNREPVRMQEEQRQNRWLRNNIQESVQRHDEQRQSGWNRNNSKAIVQMQGEQRQGRWNRDNSQEAVRIQGEQKQSGWNRNSSQAPVQRQGEQRQSGWNRNSSQELVQTQVEQRQRGWNRNNSQQPIQTQGEQRQNRWNRNSQITGAEIQNGNKIVSENDAKKSVDTEQVGKRERKWTRTPRNNEESSKDADTGNNSNGAVNVSQLSDTGKKNSQEVISEHLETKTANNGVVNVISPSETAKKIDTKKLKGDVNNDNQVNADDETALAEYLAGKRTDINVSNADLNGDSKVTSTDASKLKEMLKPKEYKEEVAQRDVDTYADKELTQNLTKNEVLKGLRIKKGEKYQVYSEYKDSLFIRYDISDGSYTTVYVNKNIREISGNSQSQRVTLVEVAKRYVDVYDDAALTQKKNNSYIDKGETYWVKDEINQSLYVKYKSDSGADREGYVSTAIRQVGDAKEVTANQQNNNYREEYKEEVAKRHVDAYNDAALISKKSNSYIDKGETYWVIEETEQSLHVKYKSDSGADREGYVNKLVRYTEEEATALDLYYPDEGWYYLQSLWKTDCVIAVDGVGNGANVIAQKQMDTRGNKSNQKWYLSRQGNSYRLRNESTNLYLNLSGNGFREGLNINAASSASDRTLFNFCTYKGYIFLQPNGGGNYVMDLYGGNDSAYSGNVQIYPINLGVNQVWQLIKTTETPSQTADNTSNAMLDAVKRSAEAIAQAQLNRRLTIDVVRGIYASIRDDNDLTYADGGNRIWADNSNSHGILLEDGIDGEQCFAFANYFFKVLHGKVCGSSISGNKLTVLVGGKFVGEYSTAEEVYNAFCSGIIRTGDFLQWGVSSEKLHSAILVNCSSEYEIVVADANRSDTVYNIIRCDKLPQDYFSRKGAVSVYTCDSGSCSRCR